MNKLKSFFAKILPAIMFVVNFLKDVFTSKWAAPAIALVVSVVLLFAASKMLAGVAFGIAAVLFVIIYKKK